jgi:hypothetical protein
MLIKCIECGGTSFKVHFHDKVSASFDSIDHLECTECGTVVE